MQYIHFIRTCYTVFEQYYNPTNNIINAKVCDDVWIFLTQSRQNC